MILFNSDYQVLRNRAVLPTAQISLWPFVGGLHLPENFQVVHFGQEV
jgi:hypothetical protein